MAALASDCLMYFRRLLWNCCMDFNKILQEASTYKCITSLNQLANNYTIAHVSYWLTRFQFLRNHCMDSNKMLRKKEQFWINFA